jgi:sterol desaturase/sphingolipid hydroxylase (fatty acid hydroxylase superfamily)
VSATLNASSSRRRRRESSTARIAPSTALIGTIVFAASVTILLLGISEPLPRRHAIVDRSAAASRSRVGFIIALGGTILFGGITTLSFLVKLARGHRSWRTPLWGAILGSAAQIIGFLIMTTAL